MPRGFRDGRSSPSLVATKRDPSGPYQPFLPRGPQGRSRWPFSLCVGTATALTDPFLDLSQPVTPTSQEKQRTPSLEMAAPSLLTHTSSAKHLDGTLLPVPFLGCGSFFLRNPLLEELVEKRSAAPNAFVRPFVLLAWWEVQCRAWGVGMERPNNAGCEHLLGVASPALAVSTSGVAIWSVAGFSTGPASSLATDHCRVPDATQASD